MDLIELVFDQEFFGKIEGKEFEQFYVALNLYKEKSLNKCLAPNGKIKGEAQHNYVI